MTKFKKGDKVKMIKTNKTHLVTDVNYNEGWEHIQIDELDNYWHFSCKFELVEEPEFKVEAAPKEALRYNSNKVEFDDIPVLGLVEVAKVGAKGRLKYGRNNWRKEASTTQYLNCTLRHIIKYLYGEEKDQETKCKHIGHACWNLLALLEKQITGNEKDDRFKYDNLPDFEEIFKIKEEK